MQHCFICKDLFQTIYSWELAIGRLQYLIWPLEVPAKKWTCYIKNCTYVLHNTMITITIIFLLVWKLLRNDELRSDELSFIQKTTPKIATLAIGLQAQHHNAYPSKTAVVTAFQGRHLSNPIIENITFSNCHLEANHSFKFQSSLQPNTNSTT